MRNKIEPVCILLRNLLRSSKQNTLTVARYNTPYVRTARVVLTAWAASIYILLALWIQLLMYNLTLKLQILLQRIVPLLLDIITFWKEPISPFWSNEFENMLPKFRFITRTQVKDPFLCAWEFWVQKPLTSFFLFCDLSDVLKVRLI